MGDQMRCIKIILLLTVFKGVSEAQETVPLSLDDCLKAGYKHSKSIDAALAKTEGSRALFDQSNSVIYPSLKVSGGYSRLSEVPPFQITIPGFPVSRTMTISESVKNNTSLKLTLQQPIFTGGRLNANIRMNHMLFKADSSDYNQQQAETSLIIRIMYWRLYQAVITKELAHENIVLLEQHLKDVGQLSRQGLATENDLLKIELQLSNAKLLFIEAESNHKFSTIQLNSYIGLPLNLVIVPVTCPDTSVVPDSKQEELFKYAITKRSDLLAMKCRHEAVKHGKDMAVAGWYPQLHAIGNYTYANPNPRIFPAKDQFDGTWDIGVLMSLDIWNWKSTGHQVRQMQSQLRQTEDLLFLQEEAIKLEIITALLDIEKARMKIDVTRTGLVQAQENYRITGNLFKQGMATNSDLLDAEIMLMQSKVNQTGAAVEYQIARDKLKKAVGDL